MINFKPLLDMLCKYERQLPKDVAKMAMQLKDRIGHIEITKFGEIVLSSEEEQKLYKFLPELIYKQLRALYNDVNARATMHDSWEGIDEMDDFYFLHVDRRCPCMYFEIKRYSEDPDKSFVACKCHNYKEDIPPTKCPIRDNIIMSLLSSWIKDHSKDIINFLGEDINKLNYIIRNPAERYSGYCKSMVDLLSQQIFSHFFNNDTNFKALCNQLTPNHC